jgi:hypothetical protein
LGLLVILREILKDSLLRIEVEENATKEWNPRKLNFLKEKWKVKQLESETI